jgi:hypothetical protein
VGGAGRGCGDGFGVGVIEQNMVEYRASETMIMSQQNKSESLVNIQLSHVRGAVLDA